MPPRRFLTTLALLLVCGLVFSTVALASDVPKEHTHAGAEATAGLPFEPTEQLVFEGEFSKLLLRGIKIAELKFTAGRKVELLASVPAAEGETKALAAPLVFTGDIESKGWFRKLFGINFRFHAESTVASDSFAVMRTTKTDEQGKRIRQSEAVFDRAANKIEWTERDPNNTGEPPRVVTAPLGGAMFDIISALYFLRTQNLEPGRTLDLIVSDSAQVYHVPTQVFAERKKMKSVVGKVSVVRLDIGLFGQNRPVAGDGKMSLWVTDDARRIPLRARMSNNMGTLDISLKSINTAAAR
ncbi:MAG: DUF3108 domain-containing protein [Pyrinomonadaceae bacterium]